MEVNDGSALIDVLVGLDYCRPHAEAHETARSAIHTLSNSDIDLEMRRGCWDKLTEALSDEQTLLIFLQQKATEYLKNYDSTERACNKFNKEIITTETLFEPTGQGINLDSDLAPSIDQLRAATEEMGLKDLRAYTDSFLQDSPEAQTNLELMTGSFYTASGSSVWIFSSTVEDIIEPEWRQNMIVDAYVWGREGGDVLLTRRSSSVHQKQSDLYDAMEHKFIRIRCSEEIIDAAR